MSKENPVIVAPSLLAADFSNLEKELKRVEESGADMLHLDVMDGHFVRNLSFGPPIIQAVKRSTKMFLDTHLMIYEPYNYIEAYAEAGADRITIHLEATEDVEATLNYIRKCGKKAGLAINPETDISLIVKYLTMCDVVLLMTVVPGFGGQAFMPEVLKKISFIREICDSERIREGGVVVARDKNMHALPPFPIQVDGGINMETALQCYEAGATEFVAGTYLFESGDMKTSIDELRGIEKA